MFDRMTSLLKINLTRTRLRLDGGASWRRPRVRSRRAKRNRLGSDAGVTPARGYRLAKLFVCCREWSGRLRTNIPLFINRDPEVRWSLAVLDFVGNGFYSMLQVGGNRP